MFGSICRSSAELTDVFEDDFFEGEPWSPPQLELRLKVAAQLEYYLSDENLTRDAFLLKHIQKNRMGFVSLKLLTSFKKVIQRLTRPQVRSPFCGAETDGFLVCLSWIAWRRCGS